MAKRVLLLTAALATAVSAPVLANNNAENFTTVTTVTTVTETVIYEDDATQGYTVAGSHSRLLPYDFSSPEAGVQEYGPFRMISSDTAEMIGEVDSATPALFRQMLGAHPGIRTLQLTDVAGTVDDDANLRLARMIRAEGIGTYVPAGGSVRSGGVELFAAGAWRRADPGAEFVVHSWIDEDGYEANDFPMSDPVHQGYIQYYRDMGLSADNARAFYALTNSVAHDDQRRVTLDELRRHRIID